MFPHRPGPSLFQRSMMPRPPMNNPFQLLNRPQHMIGGGMGRGGGLRGLLSRFFPSSQMPLGTIQQANTAASGIQGLTNPRSLSSMLGNVQKMLGVAQQVTPMVQQYGPLIKNVPAMFKIYQQFKNNNDEESNDLENHHEDEANNKEKDDKENVENMKDHHEKTTPKSTKKGTKSSSKPKRDTSKKATGKSVPKLYV